MEKPSISFDAEGRVRVLDADKFKASEELEKEARAFLSKIQEFSATVHTVVDNLGQQAGRIETAKLKSIGQRSLVESERDARRHKVRELQMLIDERSAELRRLTVEWEALLRLEAHQREVIEKLGDNEPGGM